MFEPKFTEKLTLPEFAGKYYGIGASSSVAEVLRMQVKVKREQILSLVVCQPWCGCLGCTLAQHIGIGL